MYKSLSLLLCVVAAGLLIGGIVTFATRAESFRTDIPETPKPTVNSINAQSRSSALPTMIGDSHQQSIWDDFDEKSLRASDVGARRQIFPNKYRVLSLDENNLNALLRSVPMEGALNAENSASEIAIPLPAGGFGYFRFVESPIMEKELSAKFPGIRTFSGIGNDDPTATVRFDITPKGFHAQILSASGAIYVDPYMKDNTSLYISYDKRDLASAEGRFACTLEHQAAGEAMTGDPLPPSVRNGATRRTYRLALAADGEYTQFQGGTVNGALSAMVTSINRVDGIYERELSIRLVLIGAETSIIYTNAASDPYTNNSGSTMLNENQTNLDATIGTGNYDIGHVFSTGGGGIASLFGPCNSSLKARGVTGSSTPVNDAFDVDFVAHEMGHQFGADHTFAATNAGNCTITVGNTPGTYNPLLAFEPGSGSTIMSYAGICAPQNLQLHSDPFFHNVSLAEIVAFSTDPARGDSCAVRNAQLNATPNVTTDAEYTVPRDTPFTLTAAGSDPNDDPITYSWEQYDIGTTAQSKPIFRAYSPSASNTRTFPSWQYILNNGNTPPANRPCVDGSGTCLTGEVLSTVDRQMNFRVTVRDARGAVSDAATVITVSGDRFSLLSPNTTLQNWTEGESKEITWQVGGSATLSPNIRITLSTDGGATFPVTLAESTANDGTEFITVPRLDASTNMARVKIESIGNIFFDVSDQNFTVAAIPRHSISGRVTEGSGGVQFAIVRLRSGSNFLRETGTNGNGDFVLNDIIEGTYELLAAKPGYTFTPTTRTFNLTTDLVNQNFAGAGFVRENGRIAFASDENPQTDLEVYTMNPDGTDRRRITDRSGEDAEPSISPDGMQIVYRRDSSIYKVSADGTGTPEQLTFNSIDSQPSWSPDGSQIAFVRKLSEAGGNNFEVFVMTSGGSGQRRLTDSLGADREPAWSNDSRTIYFSSNRTTEQNPTGDFEIFKTPAWNGALASQVTNNLESDTEPTFSPIADRLVWTGKRGGNDEILTRLIDQPGETNLTNNAASDSSAVFSPEGTQIAFVSSRDGDTEVFVMNADGTGQTQRTANSANDFAPDWGSVTSPAFPVRGRVLLANGTPVQGLAVTLSQNGSITATADTDVNGFYDFHRVKAGGNYSVKPDPTNFYYTPPSQTITNLSGAVTLPNFVATQSTTYTWNGTTGSWSDFIKWSPAGVPADGDRVIINSGTVNMNMLHTVRELNMGGGQLQGGSITVLGGLNFTSGQINTTITLANGSASEFNGESSKQLIGLLTNNGNIEVNGIGNILCGSVTIENNGTFNINRDGSVFNLLPGGYGASFFNNGGTVNKTAGAGDVVFSESPSVNFTNRADKTINVASGSIRFPFGSTLAAGTNISGAGRYLITSGTTVIGGQLNLTGNFEMIGGELQSSSAVTLNYTGNRMKWIGGVINGTFMLPANANLSIESSDTKTLIGLFTNNGTVTVKGTGPVALGSVTIDNNGAFNVNRDGTLFTYPAGYGASFFRNFGTISKASTGDGTIIFTDNANVSFANQVNKTINIPSGTLRFPFGSTLLTGTTIAGSGRLLMDSGTTTAAGILNITGNLEIAGGTLVSSSVVTLNYSGDRVLWTGGTINGTFTLPAGANFNVEGADDKTLTGLFTNDGTFNVNGTGRILAGSATIENNGAFNVSRDGVLFGFPPGYGGSLFRNRGTFNKTAGAGVLTFTDNANINFDNLDGKTVNILSGTLRFIFPITLRNNTTFAGAGTVLLDTNVNALGQINISSNFELASGSINSTSNVNLNLTGGNLRWTGGVLNGTFTIPATSQLNIEGANDKRLTGLLTNNGTVNLLGVGKLDLGSVTIDNFGTFNVGRNGVVFTFPVGFGGSAFRNMGLFKKTSADSGVAILTDSPSINFDNAAGKTVDVTSGVLQFTQPLSLHDGTTLAGGGRLLISNNLAMDGSVNVTGGGLEFAAGTLSPNGLNARFIGSGNRIKWTGGTITGTFTVPSGSTFDIEGVGDKLVTGAFINAGGVFWNSGDIRFGSVTVNNQNGGVFTAGNAAGTISLANGYGGSTFSNSGSLVIGQPLGLFRFTGSGLSLTNAATGTINIDIGGATPGTGFDQIGSSENVTLGGKLKVNVLNNYLPPAGTLFPVILHGTRTGTFATVEVVNSGPARFTAQYNATDVTLVASIQTYSIAGRITSASNQGMANLTVTLGGSQSAVTSTNGTGNYSFTNLTAGGNYTVTPSSQGKTFTPAALSYNNLASDISNANFTVRGARAPFDFDGDGKTDIGIYRPAVGEWWYQRSSDGIVPAFQFGASTDKIVPGDYTGDGLADVAFWRPSTGEWFILRSEDSSYYSFPFGAGEDVPAPADYDGDGKTDAAVFRPSTGTWYIQNSTGGTTITSFGTTGDKPIVADYDGDGKADVGIFRPAAGEWWINRSTAGLVAFQFGTSSDKQVQGDYTGDGKADAAFWRPSTGEWFVARSEDLSSYYSFPFGAGTDTPAPGDYDGDGKTDATVFRPSAATWYVQRSTAGTQIVTFGTPTDRPVANAFVP